MNNQIQRFMQNVTTVNIAFIEVQDKDHPEFTMLAYYNQHRSYRTHLVIMAFIYEDKSLVLKDYGEDDYPDGDDDGSLINPIIISNDEMIVERTSSCIVIKGGQYDFSEYKESHMTLSDTELSRYIKGLALHHYEVNADF